MEYFNIAIKQLELDERAHVWSWPSLTREIMGSVVEKFKKLPQEVCLPTVDAVHLQCAAKNKIEEVYANDKRMLVAGSKFDVNVSDVIGANR